MGDVLNFELCHEISQYTGTWRAYWSTKDDLQIMWLNEPKRQGHVIRLEHRKLLGAEIPNQSKRPFALRKNKIQSGRQISFTRRLISLFVIQLWLLTTFFRPSNESWNAGRGSSSKVSHHLPPPPVPTSPSICRASCVLRRFLTGNSSFILPGTIGLVLDSAFVLTPIVSTWPERDLAPCLDVFPLDRNGRVNWAAGQKSLYASSMDARASHDEINLEF